MAEELYLPKQVSLPPEQVTAVCALCVNFWQGWGEVRCRKAKVLSIDPVSGEKTRMSNYVKNSDGNCPDYEERPPEESLPSPPYHLGWSDRISDAIAVLKGMAYAKLYTLSELERLKAEGRR
jgi:hypothetical protein